MAAVLAVAAALAAPPAPAARLPAAPLSALAGLPAGHIAAWPPSVGRSAGPARLATSTSAATGARVAGGAFGVSAGWATGGVASGCSGAGCSNSWRWRWMRHSASRSSSASAAWTAPNAVTGERPPGGRATRQRSRRGGPFRTACSADWARDVLHRRRRKRSSLWHVAASRRESLPAASISRVRPARPRPAR